MHNIEKSAFRKGEYVGYSGGKVWCITKADDRWQAHCRGDYTIPRLYATRLRDLSKKLEEYAKQ